MKQTLTLILSLAVVQLLWAGGTTTIQRTLIWADNPTIYTLEDGTPIQEIWQFEGAVFKDAHPSLPYFSYRFPVSGPGNLQVEIVNTNFEPFDKELSPDDAALADRLLFNTSIGIERRKYFGTLAFIPIRKNGSSYERLVSFELRVRHINGPGTATINRNGNTYTSVLSDGDLFKIEVSKTGLYKLDYDFLSSIGVAVDAIAPNKIQLFGNGGGMLPVTVDAERYDDLVENAIFVAGANDGSFDPGDYVLFYGEGPNKWKYDPVEEMFNMEMNVYDTHNYYFLKIGTEDGLRVTNRASIPGNTSTTTFDDYDRFESEQYNLLDVYDLAQGSGQAWFGDYYKNQRTYSYNNFNFPNIVSSDPVKIKMSCAVRSGTGGSRFQVTAAGQSFVSDAFTQVDLFNPNATYATINTFTNEITTSNPSIPITVEYPSTGGSNEGWLDYIQINTRRQLRMEGNQMDFRDAKTLSSPSANFTITNAGSNIEIWDVTDPLKPIRQESISSGSSQTFGVQTDVLREFIAFDKNTALLTPSNGLAIPNQNLHALDNIEMVIIYHSEFEEQAQRLADHRADHSGLNVATARIDQLFNEFSSGRRDATAIRDFAKMIYDRTNDFRYLLLFGDGSFDNRNILELGTNFLPVYETVSSTNPILAFPTDDYFGLLDDGEGDILANDFLDIAIGRLPVKNTSEATTVVDKIISYDNNPDALGDWRNRVVFVGDDEDNGRHTIDADGIAELVETKNANLNIDKIYLDGFNQISTPGGERVPSATEALNQSLFRGVLAVTYLGHGGAKGWAQERVLQIPDITSWTNNDKLPVFLTATCSFSGYDDPRFTTAGELVLINAPGGSIAMMTTVRAVYASLNEALTRNVLDTLFQKVNGRAQTFGDVLRISKNKTGGGSNSRKFTLLGDPSQKIALPEYEIFTTTINGDPVGNGNLDTLRALQQVTIAGEIRDAQGNLLDGFNGQIFPVVFDKEVQYTTLGQDNSPILNYDLQKNVLFKGRASVENGLFEFTFVVPKDINFQYGAGKLSYYADNLTQTDATGSFEDVIIGGTDPNAVNDDIGPLVQVYMNSEEFVFGGITSKDPTLLVKLEDDNGINVVGNSIGHDLTGVLDENTQNTYLLNDFYEAALDDYTRGEVRFPLNDIEEGRHGIRVKAWDVANNAAEGYTEFVVAGSGKVALEHVLNYPNPFINSTCFQFEHNMENQEMDVQVQIYTVSGKLVKTLQERINSTGSRLSLGDCISWDGRDDFGDPLAKGVYLYKVQVRAIGTGLDNLEGESDFEKLVILR